LEGFKTGASQVQNRGTRRENKLTYTRKLRVVLQETRSKLQTYITRQKKVQWKSAEINLLGGSIYAKRRGIEWEIKYRSNEGRGDRGGDITLEDNTLN
jgi:hypothetical protein